MANTIATAIKWLNFVATRPEFRPGLALLQSNQPEFITELCDCGCNSFSFKGELAGTEALTQPSKSGHLAFQLEFESGTPQGSVEFLLYTDAEGRFDGMDVHFNGNTEPMPEEASLVEPPFHVYGELANEA